MSSVACVGDNVLDVYPDLGLSFPGGNAVNVAVMAHRCGIRSAYVGVVGDDYAGGSIRDSLISEGVAIDRLRTETGPTAYSVIKLRDGDRMFTEGHPGVSRFRLEQGDLEYLADFEVIHTGECSDLEAQLSDMAELAPVSYDFSVRPFDYCRPLLPHVWFASFSAARLDRAAADRLAQEALSLGPAYVLLTLGPNGACLYGTEIDPVEVEATNAGPLDTLGAGDAVIGCLLAGLLRADEPSTIMRQAMERAAAVCAHYGAFGYGMKLLDLSFPDLRV